MDKDSKVAVITGAPIFITEPFTGSSQADYEAMITVNTFGFFYITQLASAAMGRNRVTTWFRSRRPLRITVTRGRMRFWRP